jgi:cation transport ATPase
VITNNDIGKMPELIFLRRVMSDTIKTNITAALGTRALLVIFTVLGMNNLAFMIFADVG